MCLFKFSMIINEKIQWKLLQLLHLQCIWLKKYVHCKTVVHEGWNQQPSAITWLAKESTRSSCCHHSRIVLWKTCFLLSWFEDNLSPVSCRNSKKKMILSSNCSGTLTCCQWSLTLNSYTKWWWDKIGDLGENCYI